MMSLAASNPHGRSRRRVTTSAVPSPLWVVIAFFAAVFSLLPAYWVRREEAVDWVYGLPAPVMHWSTPIEGSTTFHLAPAWAAQWGLNAVAWLVVLYALAKLTMLLHHHHDAEVLVNRVFLGLVFGAGICVLQWWRVPEFGLATVILQAGQLDWIDVPGVEAARALAVKLLLAPVAAGLILLANGLRRPWPATGAVLAVVSFAFGAYSVYHAP